MALLDTDLKVYESDGAGNIDITSPLNNGSDIFDAVLDIDADQQKKLWLKNTSATDSLYNAKFFFVNGFSIVNTNNTPINASLSTTVANIANGSYNLTFPTVNSVVVTPPSGIPRAAQSIIADNNTENTVYLLDGLPMRLVFSSGLSTQDTARIDVSDGATFLHLAPDNANAPGTYEQHYTYSSTNIEAGTMAPGATHPFWVKQSIPDGVANAGTSRKVRAVFIGSVQ
jgi:hypothetical protein